MAKVKDYFKVFLHQLPWCIAIPKYLLRTCVEYQSLGSSEDLLAKHSFRIGEQ